MTSSHEDTYSDKNDGKILKTLNAYITMEHYYRPAIERAGKLFDPTRFSAFMEVQNPKVKSCIRDAGFGMEDFVNWVISKKIDPLSSIRRLPQIFADKIAIEIFLKEGSRSAMAYLDRSTE